MVYVRRDRAARTRTIRGNGSEPPWSRVRRRATRDLDSGDIIEDVDIPRSADSDDRRWIYDLPRTSGLRNIMTEFNYEESEDSKMVEVKDGKWKRIMKGLREHVPE